LGKTPNSADIADDAFGGARLSAVDDARRVGWPIDKRRVSIRLRAAASRIRYDGETTGTATSAATSSSSGDVVCGAL